MAFDLRKLDDQTWQIFDHSDELMFSGSLDACREWFDQQEARQQRTFLQVVSGWLPKRGEKVPQVSSPQSSSESGVLN